MAQEQQAPEPHAHAIVVRGAEDQLAALERLWVAGQTSDPEADEAAWETLRRALNASRRAEGARVLYGGCHPGSKGSRLRVKEKEGNDGDPTGTFGRDDAAPGCVGPA